MADGNQSNKDDFFKKDDVTSIESCIAKAEESTSAEVFVVVDSVSVYDPFWTRLKSYLSAYFLIFVSWFLLHTAFVFSVDYLFYSSARELAYMDWREFLYVFFQRHDTTVFSPTFDVFDDVFGNNFGTACFYAQMLAWILAFPISKKREQRSRSKNEKVIARALRQFPHMANQESDLKLGIMIYLNSKDHSAVIWGSDAVNAKVPQNTWNDEVLKLVSQMSGDSRCKAVCECVMNMGQILQTHFPEQSVNKGISNKIIYASKHKK